MSVFETIGILAKSPNNGNGHGGGHAAGAGVAGDGDRLDEVKARGRLIVGVSATPPFTFKRPGEPDHAGYDIDWCGRWPASRVAVETVSLSSADASRC
jgi:ABC-type amino acid transport substrate-binding protein